ncbi:MAG: hypothetical protein DMF72_08950 [Acidobacteria bacterium]|nr:MAG: hypothetical protein DMF72_08950 [Acidobacteriota bacterium]
MMHRRSPLFTNTAIRGLVPVQAGLDLEEEAVAVAAKIGALIISTVALGVAMKRDSALRMVPSIESPPSLQDETLKLHKFGFGFL